LLKNFYKLHDIGLSKN